MCATSPRTPRTRLLTVFIPTSSAHERSIATMLRKLRSHLNRVHSRLQSHQLIIILFSAARLRGLEKDLKLKGQEFPTYAVFHTILRFDLVDIFLSQSRLLSILYVGYILMQVPSNMFVRGLNAGPVCDVPVLINPLQILHEIAKLYW